ncbi:hypothetical protein NU08_3928 [Flavobacterium anhuiense]|uniref:Lipoprotein n=1 Tax=Flavobacterium anhuiense TaxID=459526 RepID=A0A444VU35_9FLAO|nr:hypothetical protein [Flavobacterium anhuiense]RYJ36990.1 hypothetical protein NU08_3928 [Flavobacterium anhuiense]
MKKFLCLLSAVAFVFASCSKDDSSDSASSILVRKITEFENGSPITRTVQYNGNKVVSITEEDGSQRKFTYTGNQITKIEEFDVDGLPDGSIVYGYTNGLMTSYVEKYDDLYNHKTKYTHNNDGTVSYEQFKVNIETGIEEKNGQTGTLTFRDGNLIKAERSFSNYNSVEIYEYDAKNSPLKNVVGWNLLLDDEPAINNVTKRTYISGSDNNVHTDIDITTYKYDANNFPIEKTTSFSDSTSPEIIQYTY